MILIAHLAGATPRHVGEEIWECSLADAIEAEAGAVLERARTELPTPARAAYRRELRRRVAEEMAAALVQVGDTYRAPDGVLYSLDDDDAVDISRGGGATVRPMNERVPVVEEVLKFEELLLGSRGSRRAIVRWSDGTEGVALTWYGDEVLVSEGDVVGKTQDELRSLHFRRDRDWLRS
jgi:hypothetical protein